MTASPGLSLSITIDNLDGNGAVDYSAALAADRPLRIERTLNQPSVLSCLLELGGLPVPVRRGRLIAASGNGTELFTGYLATEPVALYAGFATTGPVYRYQVSAVSDEWLLDKQPLPYLGAALAALSGSTLQALTERLDTGVVTTAGVAAGRAVGVFEPSRTASWSANAGVLAASAYAAYRVVGGVLSLQPAGAVTHVLDFDSGGDSGSVSVAALTAAKVKELANDVTLSGAMEPAAYIRETFAGDGTTTVFQLSQAPFRPAAAARALITDSFNEGTVDRQIWTLTDPGGYISLSSNGLNLNGGNGYDGETTLTALDALEIGGSLLIEAANVTLGGASQGILCGLYTGTVGTASCFAGYSVRQSSGTTLLTPMIDGVETGTSLTMQPGHVYTLRIRLQSPEMQRSLQTFYAMVGGVVEGFGGGAVAAPASLTFDLIDTGAASNTPATVLYDGSTQAPLASAPSICTFAAVDCVQLFGSIGSIMVTQTGSASVVSTLPSGTRQSRLVGTAGEGADCTLSGTGKLTFFAGRIPVAGETFTVFYRGGQRAVTRVQNATSMAAEAASGTASGTASGIARWLGKVLKPPALCSADCEAAALAVLSVATSRAAALSGSYTGVNLQDQVDVWPGDVLALTQGGAVTSVVVRKVQVERDASFPEAIRYVIAFANDWAEALGITLSEAIAADAILPDAALTTAQLAAGTVLPNLQQMQLVSATGTALQIDAGLTAPAGGGFEVRRRENGFGPGAAPDLVLRSPVRSFSIPREAQVERYYVRMYDGSTPPLYSRYSSAVFINLPVA